MFTKFMILLLFRFAIFRRCLDSEMKEATRKGLSLEIRKGEKEALLTVNVNVNSKQ